MSLQFVTPIPHRISTRAAHMNASESSCHYQRFRPNSIPRHLPGQPHAATRTAGPLFTAYTRPKPFTEPDSFPLRPPLAGANGYSASSAVHAAAAQRRALR